MDAKSGLPPIPVEEIEKLLAGSAPAIQRHAAVVILQNEWIFSGVFVKSVGYEGILTAGHCASEFLAGERFALSVSEDWHQVWVEPKAVEHVSVGYDEAVGYTSNGPDLSFIIIHDKNLRSIIRSQGLEFYDLDTNKVREVFGNDFAKFNWSVAGNPNEKVQVTKELVEGQLQKMVSTTATLIQGNFYGYDIRDNFDYVTLLLGSAFEEFPASYKGVSGGGIWYQRFITNDGKTYKVEPILAGVACWQSERTVKRGWKVRSIAGHGWVSIYGHVRRTLAEKRDASL